MDTPDLLLLRNAMTIIDSQNPLSFYGLPMCVNKAIPYLIQCDLLASDDSAVKMH